ncbi:MAG: SDR family oxidoreductase [Methylovulum sp.]|nr:SDR family oxidoreductase [Methylovulum sp.]
MPDNTKKIVIIGATSAIAHACARLWALGAAEFFLVGRDPEKLRQAAEDLTVRGAGQVATYVLDANELAKHPAMLARCFETLGRIDIALIAHGTLPDQAACEQDVNLALQEFSSNGLSVIALLTLLANRMEAQGSGTLAVISSVAGDRGRPSNYLYGTAKAAVTTFCEGLRGRLYKAGVHVITIKPGFVDTPMTQGLPLPKLLVASPEAVAKSICQAIEKRTNTLYTPAFWWAIMLVIKHIPTFIFKRARL